MDGVFGVLAEFSTIDVDKSVRNALPVPLNTRPQREKRFGTKSNQSILFFYINELQKHNYRQ
ncbi:hypothetical protein [Thiobacillus sp.]|uniref:hypothetical protein n=1 Tax=Thiobacillus sp. TaxID=924 RepID=UPI0025EE4B0A|nr:hypothetical protein [Thiobacillus sp.]